MEQLYMFESDTKRTPKINPDGVSVSGCSIIYAPRGQAGEYAPLATNPYRGCGHKCAYCYVPDVLRMSRQEFDNGATPRPGFLDNLRKDARKYQAAGLNGQVMLSFTTDPFNPCDTSLTRPTIETLIEYGLSFCTLTKGGGRALPFMVLFRPERDAFASTLTTQDDAFSLKWERGAALPGDRIATLRKFHAAGIFTWVSLEPTLSTESSLQILQDTHEFVDLFKIGRANYLPMTNTTDWESYTHQVIELCHKLGIRHYIKKDLQPYLPPGYHNPLRIAQHH
jgi:DNA repair photolyase